MAVRIRLKKMGRRHRPFFRICAMDSKTPRGGRVIEELGTYDPMIADTDARAILRCERIDYWLGVGAQPTEKVGVLIKKYGSNGTRVSEQSAAIERLAGPKAIPDPGEPAYVSEPEPTPEPEAATKVVEASEAVEATEKPVAEEAAAEAVSDEAAVPAEAASEESPAEEAVTEEPAAGDAASEEAAETKSEEKSE